jgi:uncharacterized membrane protein
MQKGALWRNQLMSTHRLIAKWRTICTGCTDQQTLLNCRRTPANDAEERGDQEQNNCYEKYDLGGLDRNASNAAEAKHRGNQRDDKKCYSPAKHGTNPFYRNEFACLDNASFIG